MIPQCSLVLACLMGKPFEPMARCLLALLSMSVCFLIVVTSARRVNELEALLIEQLFLKFFPMKNHNALRSQFSTQGCLQIPPIPGNYFTYIFHSTEFREQEMAALLRF